MDPHVGEVKETESVANAMSGLNEKIEKLVVELKYMHDENDNLRLNFAKDKAILTKAFEAKINKKEEENRAKVEQAVEKESTSLTEKYEALIREKDEEFRKKAVEFENLSKDLQDKLDHAQKSVAEKEEELSRMKDATDSTQDGCGCRHSDTHECDWSIMQKKIDSQDQVIKDLEQERSEFVARVRQQEADSGELSKQLEIMRTRAEKDLQDEKSLLSKTESIVKTKDELLEAKQEIIDNLKFKVGVLQEKISKNVDKDINETNLTSNKDSSPAAKRSEPELNPKGVDEACEFIKVYAKDGVVINGFLLWANLQRVTRPEKEWKEEAVASFLKGEITDAKDSLWRICGDKIALPYKKRQGPSKSTSEVDDIAKALRLLAEKESLPLIMATGDMVKETPITSHPNGEDSNEKVMTSLKEMEDTLQTILESTGTIKSSEGGDTHELSESQGNNRKLQNRDGTTVTWAEVDDIDPDQSWEIQVPKNAKTKASKQDSKDDKAKKQSWKDRLNILQGRATGEINEIPQSADVHLVAYGFGKDTTGEQLRNWLQSNGLQVKNCILLTKYEGARSNTFKISIKAADYEKATNPDIWPEKVGVRKFKFFDTQRNTNVLGKSKSGNQGWDRANQAWKFKNPQSLHKGFLNFHPPSDEQVRQFYQSFASNNSTRGEQDGIPNTPPGHTYSDVTRNVGGTQALQNYRNSGAEQNRMASNLSVGNVPSYGHNEAEQSQIVGNLNIPRIYNYGTPSQSNGNIVPSMNLQSGNQQFPYQSAFRAEEAMRGVYSQ